MLEYRNRIIIFTGQLYKTYNTENDSTIASFVGRFFYEAIFVPEGVGSPSKSIITSPELQLYVNGFGASKDDFALVIEVENKIIGTILLRIMNDYWHIDDKTPSLVIFLYKNIQDKDWRSLIKEMLSLLQVHNYKHVSLSDQKTNYACKLYQKQILES